MTAGAEKPRLPWSTTGARLHWPRDGHLAYVVGRMGVARSVDIAPLLYGSPGACRIGFARLQRLGLLRMFPRANLAEHGWYGLSQEASAWVAEAMGCEDHELRVVHGVSRMNLGAVRDRNRLWVSAVMASRATEGVRVALVRPEWELRRARQAGTRLVPDLQLVLETTTANGPVEVVWFVELDAGTERLAVIEAKAHAYLDAERPGALYGERAWRVVVLVPSLRRARSVAGAVTRAAGGGRVWVAVQAELEDGRAFESRLWRCDELSAAPKSDARWSLVGDSTPIHDLDLRVRSAADRGCSDESREVP